MISAEEEDKVYDFIAKAIEENNAENLIELGNSLIAMLSCVVSARIVLGGGDTQHLIQTFDNLKIGTEHMLLTLSKAGGK